MQSIRTLAWGNALAFLVHVTLSQLSALNALGGPTVGEISDKYPSLFTPAGFTFAIWGVIYIALLAFCIYHLRQAYKSPEEAEPNRDLLQIGSLFILNNLATAAWVVFWQYEFINVAALLLIVQFLSLLLIHIRLHIYSSGATLYSKLFTQIPLSLYFGWISVAVTANISSALRAGGFGGWGLTELQWMAVILVVIVAVAAFMVLLRRNIAFGLVIVWALNGIAQKHNANLYPESETIVEWAYTGVGFVSILVLIQLLRNFRLNFFRK